MKATDICRFMSSAILLLYSTSLFIIVWQLWVVFNSSTILLQSLYRHQVYIGMHFWMLLVLIRILLNKYRHTFVMLLCLKLGGKGIFYYWQNRHHDNVNRLNLKCFSTKIKIFSRLIFFLFFPPSSLFEVKLPLAHDRRNVLGKRGKI